MQSNLYISFHLGKKMMFQSIYLACELEINELVEVITPSPAHVIINDSLILLNQCGSNNSGVTMLLRFRETVVTTCLVFTAMHLWYN